jgi:hypothetical protein
LGIASICELLLDGSREVHWRGTITDRGIVHLAIQNADKHVIDVVWMEQVVDAEYSRTLPASKR